MYGKENMPTPIMVPESVAVAYMNSLILDILRPQPESNRCFQDENLTSLPLDDGALYIKIKLFLRFFQVFRYLNQIQSENRSRSNGCKNRIDIFFPGSFFQPKRHYVSFVIYLEINSAV